MYISLLIIFVLVVINGWFSTLEAALLSVNTNKIKFMVDSGDEKAIVIHESLKSITKQLSAIQIGITFTGLLASSIASDYFAVKATAFLFQLGFTKNQSFCYVISIFGITFILTYFILIFGAMIPKRIGIKYAEKIVYRSVHKMKFFRMAVYPFVFIAMFIANSIVRLFGINPNEVDANVTEEEIRLMVDAGGNDGSIDENEKEMINNIFEFDDTSAGDIATHRTDIVAVPDTAQIQDIIELITEQNFSYSRIPVYEESIDNIIGIFHVKDILRYILSDKKHFTNEGFHLADILMTPFFVPFSKKIDELFEEMQKEKVHMAIVIDEYGGTAGLVTMEDLLEEIVGNIFDEYDVEEEEEIVCVDESTFLIHGTTDLSDVESFFDVSFEDDEDYDTLGGFLIGQLGRIPEEGEHPEITLQNLIFCIDKIVEKRIDLVRVSKIL